MASWPKDEAANADIRQATEASYGNLDLEDQALTFAWDWQDRKKLTGARRSWWNWLKRAWAPSEPGHHPEEVDRKEYLRRYGHMANPPVEPDGEEEA